MVSTLVTIWIVWLILCPLNIVFFLRWRKGKELKTKEGLMSGGGMQLPEWQMIALFSSVAALGIFLGILHVLGYTAIPIG
jgi:hypothetical protein